ncbi:hypothetical protein K0M31_014191, partial [Melipona bicolor]
NVPALKRANESFFAGSRFVHSEGHPRELEKSQGTSGDGVDAASSTQGILEFHYSDEHRSVTDRSPGKVSAELHE